VYFHVFKTLCGQAYSLLIWTGILAARKFKRCIYLRYVQKQKDVDVKTRKSEKVTSWPRVAGKFVFCFFGGKTPLIGKLQATDGHNTIPTDYIECWATCIWLIHSCIIRANAEKESEMVIASLRQIMSNIYALTGLRKDELLSPVVTDLLRGMERRFCRRLDIEDNFIIRKHQEITNQLIAA